MAVFMMTACAPANPSSSFAGAVFVQRHGQSEANVAGIIASTPETALHDYGLTYTGRRQAARSARAIKSIIDRDYPNAPIVIAASPLLRAQETAKSDLNVFGKERATIITDERFTERDFAYFEGQSDDRYEDVWAYDRIGRTVSGAFNHKVEELVEVRDRTQEALRELKTEHPNAVIVIVTHGDVASNMIALDTLAPLKKHREVGGLETAGFRELKRK